MYDSYIESASNDKVVEEFKEYLKSNSNNNYATWGDFEISMARHVDAYSNEDDFIKCVRDFKGFMARHLQNEQEKFYGDLNLLDVEIVYAELKRSFSDFYRFNTPNVTNSVLEIKKQSTAILSIFTKLIPSLTKSYPNVVGVVPLVMTVAILPSRNLSITASPPTPPDLW